jgi:2',3'-cyclic-nucleotide 2'-phosphodiesterase (5'-nucleotidase family)
LIRHWLDASPEHREVLLQAPVLLETNDEACRSRSTNFGNFVADVISGRLRKRKPDRIETAIGLVNGGSFRLNRDIVKDEAITKGVVCDLLFHPNDVRMYKMPGSCLQQILLRAHSKFRNQGNFIQISGLDVKATTGSLRIQIEADGKLGPLELAKEYTVATTSYLATSKDAYGDLFGPLAPPDIIESSIKDAVESELLAQGSTSAFSDSRRWH